MLNITLLDCFDTTREKLRNAGHKSQYCDCSECKGARRIEDKWVARLGTMFGTSGLNSKEDT